MTAETVNPASESKAGLEIRAREWWARYCGARDADPGVRARLRRCRTPVEALSVRPAIVLARQLGVPQALPEREEWRLIRALNLARVLAHVTNDDRSRTPMQAAGWRSFPGERKESDVPDGRPILSELRFRRLIDVESGEEQVTAFVRLVRQLDGSVDVAGLAKAFLYWNDRTKKRWAFDYYAAGIAAPRDLSTISEDDEA